MKAIEQNGNDGFTRTPRDVHTNSIGSATVITDGNDDLVEKISHDVFGRSAFTDVPKQPLTSSSIENEILFQGRKYDEETNLYYYQKQHYAPLMESILPDHLRTDSHSCHDSMNLYQRFNMNPVNFTNPMGENIFRIDLGNGCYFDVGVEGAKGWPKESNPGKLDFSLVFNTEHRINSRMVSGSNDFRIVVSLAEFARITSTSLNLHPIIGTAKGKPGSPRDIESALGIKRERVKNYAKLYTNVDEIEIIQNPKTGTAEIVFKGNVDLTGRYPILGEINEANKNN